MTSLYYIITENGNKTEADELQNQLFDVWQNRKANNINPKPPEAPTVEIVTVNPVDGETFIITSIINATANAIPRVLIFYCPNLNLALEDAFQYWGEQRHDYHIVFIYGDSYPDIKLNPTAGVIIPDNGPKINATAIEEFLWSTQS